MCIGMNLNLKKLKFVVLFFVMGFGFFVYVKLFVDLNKVLNIVYEVFDDGFDMVKIYNFYSGSIV